MSRSTCGSERVRVGPDGTQRGFETPLSQQGPYEAVNPSLGSTCGGPFRRECCSSALDYASMTVVIPSIESLQWEYPSCPRRVAPQIVNPQMKNLSQRSGSSPSLSQPGRLRVPKLQVVGTPRSPFQQSRGNTVPSPSPWGIGGPGIPGYTLLAVVTGWLSLFSLEFLIGEEPSHLGCWTACLQYLFLQLLLEGPCRVSQAPSS